MFMVFRLCSLPACSFFIIFIYYDLFFLLMAKKFCPKCGKPVKKGSFCDDCNPETIDFKPISIKLSPSGRVFLQGKWTNFNSLRTLSEGLVKRFVKQKATLDRGLEEYRDLLEKTGLKKTCELEVVYNGRAFRVPVSVEVTLSPDVAKVGSAYFEGILQLRNARQDVKGYIRNYCAKNRVFVNKVADKGGEVDYFFVRKREMQPLALKLMRNFGAKVESNARLFSRDKQTSRDIYRQNILVTVPGFAVGDVVDANGCPFYVKETSKIITGINLATGKKSTFRGEEAGTAGKLPVFKSRVISVRPEVQVLDPETYGPLAAKNPLGIDVRADQNVQFVKYRGNAYLVK
jgi:NMD protein affecting ribosome stability and mRNA decay